MQAQDVRVLAILVATNGGEWLPECIRALHDQTHESLDVIAVDNACTDGSGAMLAKAFGGNAITLDRRVGYGRACAAALKAAGERGADPDAFLLLHDDTAMEPDAVVALVEVMLADPSVGIVGGKLREWDDPAVLQEVGMSTDRYGRLFGKLERGELDHGQHDGTRETLFCTSAMLIVRREVVERVGLFDHRYVAMRDDLDLSWRARLAGFRTVVTTDARARHASAAARGRRDGPVAGAARYFSERNRIATLLKNYSARRLAAVIPVVLMQSIAGAVLYFARGRRRIARQILGALEWNIVHIPSTLRARARARRNRSGDDAAVLKFMVRGAPRLRGYVERVLESVVGEPVQGLEETEIGIPLETPRRRRLREVVRAHPVGAAVLALLAIYLVGARSLYGPGGLAGAGLLPFPSGPSAFFEEFASGWRGTGAAGAHPPGLGMLVLGILSVLSLGSTWLAERILVLTLLPIAAGLAFRTAGRLGLGSNARLVAALAYGFSPLALSVFGDGRLPELILLAAAPGLILAVITAAGTDEAGPGVQKPPLWRSLAPGTAGLAVAGSLSPYALPFTLAASGVVAIAASATGGRPKRALLAGAAMTAGSFALLFPWSLELLRPGTPLSVGGTGAAIEMLDLVRLAPGGSPLGVLAYGFPVAGLLGLWLCGRRRPRLAMTLASLAGASLLAAWGSGRIEGLAPRASLPLVGACLAFALLAAMAADAAGSELRDRTFGFRHLAAAPTAALLVFGLVSGTAWAARGDFTGLRRSGDLLPAFVPADVATAGDFRVLWLGPAPRGSGDEVGIDLTAPGGETMLSYGVRRSGAADGYLARAAAAVLGGQSDQGGRLLAPLGVRHVIVRPDAPRSVQAALERQTDLRFRLSFGGARVFDNLAWLPVAAPLRASGWVPASRSADPFAAVLSVDVAGDPARGLDREGPARFSGRIDPATTTVVVAESFDEKWRLEVGGVTLTPRRAFGFATAFDVPPRTPGSPSPSPAATATQKAPPANPRTPAASPARSPGARPSPARTASSPTASPSPAPAPLRVTATVAWRGQSPTRLLLLAQLGLWLVFAAWWSGRRAVERGER